MVGDGGELRDHQSRFGISRLTILIILVNLIGPTILVIGSFALNHYRDGLVAAKLQGVRAQAQIVADVLAQVAIDDLSCEPFEEDEELSAQNAARMCAPCR